ncbi:MAG: right-handed parallel beta-helix repeat-containing protein [Planctomycetes bacterium]|nr:right-handed parallel beta-helix repeat-containing protein [Planctomycetota bacterium]
MKRTNALAGLMGLALFAGSVRGGTVSPSDPGLSSETAGTPAFTAPSIGRSGADGTPIQNLDTLETFATIQEAIDDPDTLDGHTIEVQSTPHSEGPQINVSKSITLQGSDGGATILAIGDTSSSGDARGWFLVPDGEDVHFKNLTFDGNGHKIWQAIRARGSGSVVDCSFNDIRFDANGPSYAGTAVVFFGAGNWTITNNTLTNIGRNGIFAFGAGVTNSVIDGNTYTGKGVGDQLDYGVELGGGAVATVTNNTITQCRGVASSDGSISVGMLITTFFGEGTAGDLTGNFINDNTGAIAAGFDSSDTSTVVVNDNDLSGSDSFAVQNTSASTILNASANWWGANDPATVASLVDGSVDYTPWLDVGTDTSGDPGFQGDFAVLNVDDDSPQTGSTGRIQEGVDLVTASTVNVLPGTYEEQVVITKDNVQVIGSGFGSDPNIDTIILSPTTLTYFFTTSADNFPVIGVDNAAGVSIENLRVDGDGRGNLNFRFVGIGMWNAGTDVIDCVVTRIQDTPFNGSQHGVGIFAANNTGGPLTVNISGTVVDEYQKNAMALTGDGLTANVVDCTTTGIGPTTVTAQNGIQISHGAGGTVQGCTVSSNEYTVGNFASSGLLIFNSTGVDVTNGNQIVNNFPGVFYQDSTGTFDASTVANPTADPGDGFYVFITSAQANAGAAAGGPRVRPMPFEPGTSSDRQGGEAGAGEGGVVVTNSEFIGHDLPASWGVTAFSSGAVSVLSVSNSVVRNWDKGLVAFESGGPVDLTAFGNAVFDNGVANFSSTVADLQDASGNWWGSNDPATVASLIEGSVDYSPWLDTGTDTSGDPGFQGDFAVLNVDDDSPQAGSVAHIQEGVDLVSGSTVNVAPGNYVENVFIDNDLLTLASTGGHEVTTVDGDCLGDGVGPTIRVEADDVTIDGFEIINGGDDGGISFEGDRNRFTNNDIHDNCMYGIAAFNDVSDDNVIDNNSVHHNAKSGVLMSRASGSGNRIESNDVFDNGDGSFHGIELLNNHNSIVTKNVVTGGHFYGIQVLNWTAAAPTGENIIQANDVTGTLLGGAGIIVWAAPFLAIEHGEPCTSDVTNNGNTLANNRVHDNLWDGIVLRGDTDRDTCLFSGHVDENLVANNQVFANGGAGINLLGFPADGGTADNNIVTGNALEGNGSAGLQLLDDARDNRFGCNDISDHPKGIRVFVSSGGQPTGNIFFNNNINLSNTIGMSNGTGGGFCINAENNWWGAESGPFVPDKPECAPPNPGGTGTPLDPSPPWINYHFFREAPIDPAECAEQNTLPLNREQRCYARSEELIVNLDVTNLFGRTIRGGEFFLAYDNIALEFLSIEPGDEPFTEEVLEVVDQGLGTIDYRVVIPEGNPSSAEDATLAVITFAILAEVCDTPDLVAYRAHDPQTRLIDQFGDDLFPRLQGMFLTSIDDTPPEISDCPDPIKAETNPGCAVAVTWAPPTAVDNCGTVNVRSTHNPGDLFDFGITTVTYTFTDKCRLSSECSFDVTVNDDEDIDLDDYALFLSCVTGPGGGPVSPECACFDANDDDDVDFGDFAALQQAFTG